MDFDSILRNAVQNLIGIDVVVYALVAIGLNIHFGYTGLLNFGEAAFALLGAYGVGIGVLQLGLPLWVSVLLGLGGSVVLALLLGIPTLRLRADYLAIATIATAEILRLAVRSNTLVDYTGGSNGLNGFSGPFYDANPIPPGQYGAGYLRYSERDLWPLLVGWALVLLCSLVVFLLMRSPWGRVLKAIREDETAARSLGKNVFSYKMQSLVLGGLVGCVAGFVFSLSRGSVQPDNYGTQLTFLGYAVLLLGGAARVFGPIVGAMILWVVLSLTDTVLREAIGAGYIPTGFMDPTDVGAVRFIFVGLLLMGLVVFRPQGIFGDRRELMIDVR